MIPANEFFRGPRLKIERAKQHISDLHLKCDLLAQSSPYALRIDRNSQTGNDVLQIEVSELVPDDFALIIGDALHNLKSALDLTVNEIVFRQLHRRDTHARFPFRETRNELVTAVNGGLIHQASKAVADYIVNVIKPYKGGNDALWSLHDLNILDKHRLLLPVMNVSIVNDIRTEDERGQTNAVDTWVLTGNRIARYELIEQRNSKITNKGKPSLLILFDKGLPLEGEAVLPSLHQLTKLVSSTIEGIGTVFLWETV